MKGRALDVNIKIHKNPFPAGWAGNYNSRSITTFVLNFGRKARKIKNKKPLG